MNPHTFPRPCRWLARIVAALTFGLAVAPGMAANLYLAGPDVRLEQEADGDVVAGAGRLVVDARISGDAVLAAGSLDVRAPVGDDLRAAGGILTLSSTVKGEALLAGATIHIAKAADLAGRVWLAGNEVIIDGRIRGEVKVYGRSILVGGELLGPVVLAGESIEITPDARISGDVFYTSSQEIVISPGARVSGKVTRQPGVFEIPRPTFEVPGLAAARPLLLFGLLAAGMLFYALFPRYTIKAARGLQRAPLKSLGLGAAMFFSVPPIILLLVITIIGIPVALVVAAVYAVAVLAGYLVAGFFLGDRLLQLVGKPDVGGAWRLGSLALGLAALWLVRHVPYVGDLIILTALLLGLGALALQAVSLYAERS